VNNNIHHARCERCGALGEDVHHKERLTIHNVMDHDVSLNQKNLELLCEKCHNKITQTFLMFSAV